MSPQQQYIRIHILLYDVYLFIYIYIYIHYIYIYILYIYIIHVCWNKSCKCILLGEVFIYFIPTKFGHSSRSIGLPAQRGTRTGQQHVHIIQELSNEFVTENKDLPPPPYMQVYRVAEPPPQTDNSTNY